MVHHQLQQKFSQFRNSQTQLLKTSHERHFTQNSHSQHGQTCNLSYTCNGYCHYSFPFVHSNHVCVCVCCVCVCVCVCNYMYRSIYDLSTVAICAQRIYSRVTRPFSGAGHLSLAVYKHPALLLAAMAHSYLYVLNYLVGPQLHVAYVMFSLLLLSPQILEYMFSQFLSLCASTHLSLAVRAIHNTVNTYSITPITSILTVVIVVKVFCCLIESCIGSSKLILEKY